MAKLKDDMEIIGILKYLDGKKLSDVKEALDAERMYFYDWITLTRNGTGS